MRIDDFAKKNTAVLEASGRWICGDTKFAIQWGTLTALANGKTRVGGSANYRWPMAAIFHVGATTASGHANARDGFNCSISIDSYSNTGLSLAFETNGTKSITVAQKAFWFVLGIIQE